MATSTYQTYLMHKNGETYEKLIDIKEFPDLGGAPEMLETTTLSDSQQTYIAGLQSASALTFTANYDKTDMTALKALEHKSEEYAVYFGASDAGEPDGHEGKFTFTGELSVFVSSGATNAVRNMTVTIAPSTEIAFA